jgi:hypothetical protein
VSGSGWAVFIGVALVLTARPLARVGEMSGAVLSGERSPLLPATAHPALLWMLRTQGLAVVMIALLVLLLH